MDAVVISDVPASAVVGPPVAVAAAQSETNSNTRKQIHYVDRGQTDRSTITHDLDIDL